MASAVLLGAGCGGGSNATSDAVKVISAWSNALRSGDINAAAGYFALPSVFADGPGANGAPAVTIRDGSDARFVNATLPCGAKLISAARSGRYVSALFRLTGRPGLGGTDCGSGAGTNARVDFEITRGKIVAWIRAPLAPAAPPPARSARAAGRPRPGRSTLAAARRSDMFDHVTIRVRDRSASERFYTKALNALGIDESYRTETFSQWQDFLIAGATPGNPPTRRLHIAFVAPSREQVDLFWQAGTAAGYPDDGPPGPRPEYRDDYYGGFLLDPDGNSVEAVHHGALRRGGIIDHLWIRVADLAQARTFYETIAPHAGLQLDGDTGDRVGFTGASGSFSLVRGTPTVNLHLAFGTAQDAAVQRFHQTATAAGYHSNGSPAERPRYHPGYYAAYVFDPDGNNVEVVNHHRT